jgi:hypothetical protein
MWRVLQQDDPDLRQRIYSQDYRSIGPTYYGGEKRCLHMKLLTLLLHQYNVTNDQSRRQSQFRRRRDYPAERNLLSFSGVLAEDRMSHERTVFQFNLRGTDALGGARVLGVHVCSDGIMRSKVGPLPSIPRYWQYQRPIVSLWRVCLD